MRKTIIGALLLSALAFSSCAYIAPSGNPVSGVLYTGVTDSKIATSNEVGTKVGTSKAFNILGLVSVGEAGIQDAAKDGGITKISHVDTKTTGVLGLFTVTKTIIYGE